MADTYTFPTQQFYDLLLAGARHGFALLQARCRDEHVYQGVLVISGEYDCIEPGLNTEEALAREVERMRRALAARRIDASAMEVAQALRYPVPGPDYRITALADDSLAAATALLAGFGRQYAHALEHAVVTRDADGTLSASTPLDAVLDAVLEVSRAVLRTLDGESMFGTGAARDQVVLDLAWFVGGRPDAWAYATGLSPVTGSPLNPPGVQTRYERELAAGAAVAQRLFGHRSA